VSDYCALPEGYSGPWPAPIKLNLFLHITGRQQDGYHALQTLFQLLDYSDALYFRPRDDGRLHRDGDRIEGLAPENDLILRAARLLREHGEPHLGADIHLIKRAPMGGGVGGGSSDAATTLLVLNRLWGLNLSLDRLASIGLHLGADVPVFVRGHSAWAEGRGEKLTPATLPDRWYLVIAPPVHVSTAELFSAPDLRRDCPPISLTPPPPAAQAPRENVFTSLVLARHPAIRQAFDWLHKQGASPRMTGTGSCLFATFESPDEAETLLGRLPPTWRGFVARGVNASPLLDPLAAL